jgi:signal recognition particle receptor subunit beta
MKEPIFAIVGHPNQGKSSIVSTLIHQDSIGISHESGTTLESTRHSLVVDGKTLFHLVDTPGFQRPRQVIDWLGEHCNSAAKRQQTVKAFVQVHSESSIEAERFKSEVELLKPIVDGAAIIYVVDGSVPFSSQFEAEMTILQWTGQPRIALINPIGGEQYIEEWTVALGQYFSLVRVFNPMTDDLEKQQEILRSIAEIFIQWRSSLLASADQLHVYSKQRMVQSCHMIASYLNKVISHHVSAPEISALLTQATISTLDEQYKSYIRNNENVFQHQIAQLFTHFHLEISSEGQEIDYPDLFDEQYWYLFGLSRSKLIGLAGSAGAASGALIDVGVGGSSLMLGAAAGGLVSAATAAWATFKPESLKIRGVPIAGKKFQFGPITDMQFAFVLLGRAVSYLKQITLRQHAQRSPLTLKEDQKEKLLANLSAKQQIDLVLLIKRAQKPMSDGDLSKFSTLIERMVSL